MRFVPLVGLALILSSHHLFAQDTTSEKIAVDSPAFIFSPGNWTGDKGRIGNVYRQTWCPGAYFRVTWTTPSGHPAASLLLDTSALAATSGKPVLTYNVDGFWTDSVSCNADQIDLKELRGSGTHTLTVYLQATEQTDRWGAPNASGTNVLRVTGLQVDAGSKPIASPIGAKWALIIGDSITEGIAAGPGGADSLSDWSYLVGQGLMDKGYEYGVSAAGWSGWLRHGDNPPGDIPAYYWVADGVYDETQSRWDKIDAAHSLLDPNQHLSGYGGSNQEPSLILFNYGTNDALSHVNSTDLQASMTQSLTALRRAAPNAVIYLIVPFGQFAVNDLKAALAAYHTSAVTDFRVRLIDLGQPVANALAGGSYWGNLHPNARGHAVFAARILSQITGP